MPEQLQSPNSPNHEGLAQQNSKPVMPGELELFSTTHDLDRLERRLAALLSSPPAERAWESQRAVGPVRRTGWWTRQRARLHATWQSWRAQGYAVSWLIQRLPGVRDVVNLAWALLTIQGRLYRLQIAIQETQTALKAYQREIQPQQRIAEKRLQELAQRYDRLHTNTAWLEQALSEVATTAKRLGANQQADREFMQRELDLLAARLGAPATGQSALVQAHQRQRDRWYLAFEAEHRGDAESLRARQQIYLPYIQLATPDPQSGWVLDLGCGQGDWLKVLSEAGFKAEGVDTNASLVAAARRAGLRVHQADLFEYLGTLADQTYAAITAFQLVEHLPWEGLLELFAELRRTVRPGGVVILETPNPENIQVGAYSFWLDPTHVRPLPPPLLAHLAVHCGFVDIHIERLHPWPQYEPQAADPLNKLLYCEQDYALIARVPV